MARRTKRPTPAAEPVELSIAALGARGDGIARHDGGTVYVPLTVPGDRLLAQLGAARGDGRAATMLRLLAPGPGRAAPPCRHFGGCGGCALQHLDDALYAEAKRAIVTEALARHGLAGAPVAALRRLPAGTRRRVRFTLSRPPRAAALPLVGFAERASHRLVDLAECPVLDPRLVALAAPLRRLAGALLAPGESGHATVQAVAGGVDLLLDLPAMPGLDRLEALAAFAEAEDLARLAWRSAESGGPVPLAQRRPVQAVFGGIAVDVPADGFLQATPEAEAALTEAVVAAVGKAETVADLFAGLGTFTFALAGALAGKRRVHAVEGAAAAVAALTAAARRAGLAGRIDAERRDLQARPLEPDELARCDAVVFDPPRIGAAPQAVALARSRVPTVVAVSCNPASFARDAATLVAGGYRLLGVQPIDQFVWSSHIELVAGFART
jgi:23S rRNA (uracil1939-C5)-methyltransferase